jgi:hypothetical protein
VSVLARQAVWCDIDAAAGPLTGGLLIPVLPSVVIYASVAALFALASLGSGEAPRERPEPGSPTRSPANDSALDRRAASGYTLLAPTKCRPARQEVEEEARGSLRAPFRPRRPHAG